MEDNMIGLTQDDAIFFMDMIGSVKSPNFHPQLHKAKPYTKILKEKNSKEYVDFVGIYKDMCYVLSDREKFVLDKYYGVGEEKYTLQTIAKHLNITPARVRMILCYAENKIIEEMLSILKRDGKLDSDKFPRLFMERRQSREERQNTIPSRRKRVYSKLRRDRPR